MITSVLIHPIYRIVVFVAKMMFRELFDGNVYGDENIPRHGPCLLACNHLSYFDPPFIGSAVTCREVFSLARSSLFGNGLQNWIFRNMNCIPLNRESSDIGAIRMTMKLLEAGKCVMIYPEGTRSDDGRPGKAHAGVGLLACKTRAPVIPCKIFGTFEIMPKGQGFFNWNKKAAIVFGKKLLPEDYMPKEDSKEKYQIASDKIMQTVHSLKLS